MMSREDTRRARTKMKLKESYQTEVYVCQSGYVPSGYIAIKQQDALGNEPEIVLLTPEQAVLVAAEMKRLIESKED
jgi:hypothetical protein